MGLFRLELFRSHFGTRWLQIKNLLATNTTYKLSIVMDTAAQTADYYINGVLTARVGEAMSLTDLTQIRFTNLGDATVDLEYRIDNLRIVAGDVFNPQPILAPLTVLAESIASANVTTQIATETALNARRSGVIAAVLAGEIELLSRSPSLQGQDSSGPIANLAAGSVKATDSRYGQIANELFSTIGNPFD